MRTVFTRIIEGEIPSRKVYEDEMAVAFLDIDQRSAGHVLVVPRAEVDKFYEMEEGEFAKLATVAARLARALEKATGLRTKLEIIGVDVPHTHIHLVPIGVTGNRLSGMSEDEIAAKIKESL